MLKTALCLNNYSNKNLSRRKYLKMIATSIGVVEISGCEFLKKHGNISTGHFILWQLPPQTHTQMNSYVLKTSGSRIIVIDGGCSGDTLYLKGFLAALGNHVHAWFVSHPHFDHVDALIEILNDPGQLTIDKIYGSLPPESWVEKYESSALVTSKLLNEALSSSGHNLVEHDLGQVILIDGVQFEIIGIKNLELTNDADFSPVNNQSVVMRVTDTSKSILFTGDLGGGGGDKILNSSYRDKLRADYVQMSHHGQHGVYETFYQAVKPKYCLWPTPCWLWDNDNGGGKNSGPWLTLEVRAWMEKLTAQKHFVSGEGLCRIE